MTKLKLNITCNFIGLLKSIPLKNINDLKSKGPIIFKIYLPDYYNIVNELSLFLNEQETNRANRYYKEKDKNRFIICRTLLKFVLSNYTEIDTKQIKLNYNAYKKPYLSSHPSLFFNVSHYGLIAISNSSVGIDVEYIEEKNDLINSLNHIYNDEEITFIENAFDKKKAFYSLWTRKEAFVKAIGKGIDENFSKIPSINGSHILNASLINNTKNWNIHGFKIEGDYLAAVAYEIEKSNIEKISIFSLPCTIKALKNIIQK